MRKGERNLVFLFLLPAVVCLILITVYPFVSLIHLSTCKYVLSERGGRPFVGFENYVRLFSHARFWSSMRITFIYALMAVGLEFFLGLGIALVLSRELKGRNVLIPLLIVPLGVTPIVASLVWKILYNSQFGLINYLLSVVGISPPLWLSHPQWALVSLVIVDTWRWTPLMMLIFLGGLSAIPRESYEAGVVDGASKWQIFLYITLPLLRPIIAVALFIRIMDVFKAFDIIYGLTQGGPGRATETMNIWLLLVSLRYYDFGLGAALAFVMLFLVIGICTLFMRILNVKIGESIIG